MSTRKHAAIGGGSGLIAALAPVLVIYMQMQADTRAVQARADAAVRMAADESVANDATYEEVSAAVRKIGGRLQECQTQLDRVDAQMESIERSIWRHHGGRRPRRHIVDAAAMMTVPEDEALPEKRKKVARSGPRARQLIQKYMDESFEDLAEEEDLDD